MVGCRGRWQLLKWNGAAPAAAERVVRLTKVAGYRQTLCAIEAEDYLRSKLTARSSLSSPEP
jgi:hypothetical protein